MCPIRRLLYYRRLPDATGVQMFVYQRGGASSPQLRDRLKSPLNRRPLLPPRGCMVSSPSSPCPFSLTVGEKGSNGQFFPSPRDAVARERGAGVRGSQMASKAGGFRADFSVSQAAWPGLRILDLDRHVVANRRVCGKEIPAGLPGMQGASLSAPSDRWYRCRLDAPAPRRSHPLPSHARPTPT